MPGASPVIIPVKQRTPEWEDARLTLGIGASQAAAAIGVSPWQSTVGLWAEKLGLVPPQEQSIPMMIGNELEPLIARLYTDATGIKIRRATMLRQHPEHAFMLASLDRRAGRKPIELKWSARGDGYGEPGTDEVPDDVLAQVLHQLAVVDEPEGDVAALIGRRESISIFTIRRDVEAEAAIIEREAIFWDHVQSRTEPPLDGSEATRAYLRSRYPVDTGEVIQADEDTTADLRMLRAVRREQDAAAAARDELEHRIQGVMGTASKIVAPGVGSITWKATKDRETVKWKDVAAAYRAAIQREYDALASSDLVETYLPLAPGWLDTIEAEHTETKPGPRMFGPPRWEEED